MEVCCSRLRSRIRSRIWAWMVTSRAVVGSSQMSSLGLHSSAMAIITRWRMPPERLCGYSSTSCAARARPTRSSMASTRASISWRARPVWMRSISASCSPMRCKGFREVIGSWKIMAISLPRMPRRASSSACSRSRPSKRIAPDRRAWLAMGNRRRMDSAVTLLPQPDSPSRPTVSSLPSEKETPSTGATRRPWLRNSIFSLSISSMGIPWRLTW
ncbi:hypothetical protein HBH1_04692 [Herbaspirillum sp. BH-1]|nr:hypothetical protein HBH1_04692 [Herbaspirillum sp. BH-1]